MRRAWIFSQLLAGVSRTGVAVGGLAGGRPLDPIDLGPDQLGRSPRAPNAPAVAVVSRNRRRRLRREARP